MSDVEGNYSGSERRKERLKLDEALSEVQRLHNAATTLATAVTHTATRHELEELREQVKKERIVMTIINSALTFVIILFLAIFFTVKLASMVKTINRGHEVITCLQGKTEVQRTGDFSGTALVTCAQSAR